jgi:hypothetical protein
MSATETLVIVPGNPVEPSKKRLRAASYESVLSHALGGGPLEAFSRNTKPLLAPEVSGYAHGFIAAANAAYDGHYPLVISPDMIWLLIAQGFAIHVKENAEALRTKFVSHEGRASLKIRRDEFIRGFAGNDWESVFSEFSTQIRAHIGKPAHETIAPTFSTTGIVEKAAFEITLMDAMQEYFDFSLMTLCGIPEFHQEGTPEDWRLLRDNVQKLSHYDQEWWIFYLLPVLNEFIASSEGNSNRHFWQNFYKLNKESGGPYITGHIVKFFPYIPPKRHKYQTDEEIRKIYCHFSEMEKEEKIKFQKDLQSTRSPLERNRFIGATRSSDSGGMTSAMLSSSFSVAPFTWEYYDTELPMELVAGFVGASQDEKTLALRPEIGWAVRERD